MRAVSLVNGQVDHLINELDCNDTRVEHEDPWPVPVWRRR